MGYAALPWLCLITEHDITAYGDLEGKVAELAAANSAAVLPLDNALYAAVIAKDSGKRCVECGALFTAASNRTKYCPSCSRRIRRRKEAERQWKLYCRSTHLGG